MKKINGHLVFIIGSLCGSEYCRFSFSNRFDSAPKIAHGQSPQELSGRICLHPLQPAFIGCLLCLHASGDWETFNLIQWARKYLYLKGHKRQKGWGVTSG